MVVDPADFFLTPPDGCHHSIFCTPALQCSSPLDAGFQAPKPVVGSVLKTRDQLQCAAGRAFENVEPRMRRLVATDDVTALGHTKAAGPQNKDPSDDKAWRQAKQVTTINWAYRVPERSPVHEEECQSEYNVQM